MIPITLPITQPQPGKRQCTSFCMGGRRFIPEHRRSRPAIGACETWPDTDLVVITAISGRLPHRRGE